MGGSVLRGGLDWQHWWIPYLLLLHGTNLVNLVQHGLVPVVSQVDPLLILGLTLGQGVQFPLHHGDFSLVQLLCRMQHSPLWHYFASKRKLRKDLAVC